MKKLVFKSYKIAMYRANDYEEKFINQTTLEEAIEVAQDMISIGWWNVYILEDNGIGIYKQIMEIWG